MFPHTLTSLFKHTLHAPSLFLATGLLLSGMAHFIVFSSDLNTELKYVFCAVLLLQAYRYLYLSYQSTHILLSMEIRCHYTKMATHTIFFLTLISIVLTTLSLHLNSDPTTATNMTLSTISIISLLIHLLGLFFLAQNIDTTGQRTCALEGMVEELG
jgi:hypothetical protein